MGAHVKITDVTFENHHSGFAVGTATPRLSWRFSYLPGAATCSWQQIAYETQVSESKLENAAISKIESNESVLVPWPAEPMASRDRKFVRVRATGRLQDGPSEDRLRTTAWSHWALVECGLLGSADWVVKPICLPLETKPTGPLRPVRFRKIVHLPQTHGKVQHARLYITAHGVYMPYVNGKLASDEHLAPGWTSYSHRLKYQTLDITDILDISSPNVIAIELAEGWFAGRLGFDGGRRHLYGDNMSVLVQMEVTFDDSFIHQMHSDASWGSAHSSIIQSELYDGEIVDMGQEQPGWNSDPIFDDSRWRPPQVMPSSYENLVAADAPPVRTIEEIPPRKILKTPTGKTLLDFGQVLVGKIRVKRVQKLAGQEVVFHHAEVLENGELSVRPLRDLKARDCVVSNGQEIKDWSPKFTFHGFRYVQVDGWSPEDAVLPLTLDSVAALVMHSDLQRTGHFSCSDDMINRFHDNSVWSMRGNFLSIPTDCPQRDERLGWTGDIQVYAPSACFLYNTSGMLNEWLQDLASEQKTDCGIPPFVVPNVIDHLWEATPQAVWDDVAVLLPWTLYQNFGDRGILERQMESMTSWLDQGVKRGPDGLWDENLWQLGDWLDPKAPPQDPGDARTDGKLVADAYLVHSTSVLAKACSVLERQDLVTKYEKDAACLKGLFQNKYITPEGLVAGDTQTGLSLAIVFDLFESQRQARNAGKRLVLQVRRANFRVATGFAGTPIVLHALTRTGNHRVACRMMQETGCPSWLYPVTMGATTTWERWDSMLPDGSVNPGEMTSFNHYALGSAINWLHRSIAGIAPAQPVWKAVRVQPQPGGSITHAKATFESAYGLVSTEWRVDATEATESGSFKLKIHIPPNCGAVVVFPDQAGGAGAEGEVTIGSGHYEFERTWHPIQSNDQELTPIGPFMKRAKPEDLDLALI